MKVYAENEFTRKVHRYYFEDSNGNRSGSLFLDIYDDGESLCCWMQYYISELSLVNAVKSGTMSEKEFLENEILPNLDVYVENYKRIHNL